MTETAAPPRPESDARTTETSPEGDRERDGELRVLSDTEVERLYSFLTPVEGDSVRVYKGDLEDRVKDWSETGDAWWVQDAIRHGKTKIYNLRRNIDDVNSEALLVTDVEMRESKEKGSNYKIGESVNVLLDSDGEPVTDREEGETSGDWRVVNIYPDERGRNRVDVAKIGGDGEPAVKSILEESLDVFNPSDFVTHFKQDEDGEWIAYLSDKSKRGGGDRLSYESRPIPVKDLLARSEPFKGVSRETLESLSANQEGARADFTTPEFQKWTQQREQGAENNGPEKGPDAEVSVTFKRGQTVSILRPNGEIDGGWKVMGAIDKGAEGDTLVVAQKFEGGRLLTRPVTVEELKSWGNIGVIADPEPEPETESREDQNARFYGIDLERGADRFSDNSAFESARGIIDEKEALGSYRHSDPETRASIRGLGRYARKLSRKLSSGAGARLKEFGQRRPDTPPETSEQAGDTGEGSEASAEDTNSSGSDSETQVSMKGLAEYIRDLSKEKSKGIKARANSHKLSRQADRAAAAAGMDYDTKNNALSMRIPSERERRVEWEFNLGQEVEGPRWLVNKQRNVEWHVTKRFLDKDGRKMLVISWRDKKGKYHNFTPVSELELKGWQKPESDGSPET